MKRRLPRALLALGLLLANTLLAADAPRFHSRSWQSEDGLPSNVVRAVAQATDGYLWIGTAEGLVRFDGKRFTGLRNESGSMMGRIPSRSLFSLANGDVWAVTNAHTLLRGRRSRLEEVPLP